MHDGTRVKGDARLGPDDGTGPFGNIAKGGMVPNPDGGTRPFENKEKGGVGLAPDGGTGPFGNGLPTVNGQSEPLYSEFLDSESIKSPQVGFEPTTNQLTADRSTTELLRNNRRFDLIEFNSCSQPMTNMSSKLPS
ncbi:hypothetical protein FXO38_03541 [Capsicum annuum]|nr:hypothetical protein FXO38_03541 [Capsicum annuum]